MPEAQQISGSGSMQPTPMQEAVAAALYGPYGHRLKPGNHHFNVHQAEYTRVDGNLRISGVIDHSVEHGFDDHVTYHINLKGNTIDGEIKTEVDSSVVSGILKLVGIGGSAV